MYPITCHAGFSVPIKAGKFRIAGVCATISDPTAEARLVLVDDVDIAANQAAQGYVLDNIDNQTKILVDLKSKADTTGVLEFTPYDCIKTRYGLSAYFTNLVPGSVCVYEE